MPIVTVPIGAEQTADVHRRTIRAACASQCRILSSRKAFSGLQWARDVAFMSTLALSKSSQTPIEDVVAYPNIVRFRKR